MSTPPTHPSTCSQSVAYASKHSSHVETPSKPSKSSEQSYRSATVSHAVAIWPAALVQAVSYEPIAGVALSSRAAVQLSELISERRRRSTSPQRARRGGRARWRVRSAGAPPSRPSTSPDRRGRREGEAVGGGGDGGGGAGDGGGRGGGDGDGGGGGGGGGCGGDGGGGGGGGVGGGALNQQMHTSLSQSPVFVAELK